MTGQITFDASSGRCRLPRVVLDALLDVARGVELPATLREPLAAAGVVIQGRIHPALADPMRAAADPECRLVVFLAPHDGAPTRGTGWVTSGAGLVALETMDGRVDVLPVRPGFFPSALARLFSLGPRPRLAFQPVLAPHSLVEDLLSETPRTRAKATRYVAESSDDPPSRRFATLLERGPWRWNSVRAEWPSAAGGVASRGLHVWDSTEGLAIFENRGEKVAIDPMDPSLLFLLFTRLLPRPEELLDLSRLRP